MGAGTAAGPGRIRAGEAVRDHGFVRVWPDDGPIMPPRIALEHAARCLSVEDLAILLESAANTRLLSVGEIDALVATFPVKTRRAVGEVVPWAQSGTETRVRRFLQRSGVTVPPQAGLLPDERMDMVVGELLVIECDSHGHHEDPRAYANDRRRDQQLLLLGYRVLRLTWEDVMLNWPRTQELLRRIIALDLHRAPRNRRGLAGR